MTTPRVIPLLDAAVDAVLDCVAGDIVLGLPLPPFMPHSAEVAPGFFDTVVTDPAATHQLFGPPNGKVSTADYAIGLQASSLVADGGTLQTGIGSLGNAIAQALTVRDRLGPEYRRILESLCPDGQSASAWQPADAV